MIKKICIVLIINLLFISTAFAENAEKTDFEIEKGIVEAFKTGNPTVIAKLVSYPLRRPAPIPYVKDEQDFINRFDMLFDEDFQIAIATSQPSDWSVVGWRGTMLGYGILWLDDDGKIKALNSINEEERAYSNKLTQETIARLYPELRTFKKNIITFDIPLGQGRIDAMAVPGDEYDETYRYAFWNKGKDISEKPDMLIYNGTIDYQGTANNTYYIFKNGNYTYQFEITYVGHVDTPPLALVILKDGVEIAMYPATLVQ